MIRRKSKASVPKTRLPFLEGIRGVAALYVVIGHLCSLADPSTPFGRTSHAPSWLQQTMAFFSFGHLAVAAFIVISGFCLELSLFARENGTIKSVGQFYGRRSQRILPPYYACLLISVYVANHVTTKLIGNPFAQYVPVDQAAFVSHALLIHNFSLDWMYKINGVLWSIAIEVQLYILFPLLVVGINKIGRILTIAVSGGVAYLVITQVPLAPKMYIWYLPLFVIGMVAAHMAFKPGKVGRLPVVGSLLAIACIGGCWWTLSKNLPIYDSDALLGAAVAAGCYAMTGAPRGPLYRLLSTRPIVALGTFSYSLYLMHHPVAQILYAKRPFWAKGEVSLFLYLIGSLPVVLVACWLFYLLFERPFIPKRRDKPDLKPKQHAPSDLPLRTYRPSKAA